MIAFVINVLENVCYNIYSKNYRALFNSYNYYNEKKTLSLYNTIDLIASLTIWIAGSWTGGIVLVLLRRSSRDRQLVFRSGLAQPLRRGAAFVSSASRWHRGRRQCRRGWRGGTIKYELGYLPATNSGAVGTFV